MTQVIIRVRNAVASRDEAGFTTAELLGNAALGVGALVGIWLGVQEIGDEVMNFISDQLTSQ